MAMGFQAWNAFNALNDLHEEMNEMERIEGQRIIRRMLRDMMDPFECPENVFNSFFRVSRQLGRDLCDWLRPDLQRERSSGLTVETQVLCSLRFFATGSYQAQVGQDANISLSQTSVSRAINVVARTITRTLLQEFVKLPSTAEEIQVAKAKFANCAQPFPNTIGAIDCTHIAIVGPREHEENFINHHGYHSLNVQLVCDPSYKILAANARYGGRAHDTFIWHGSQVREELRVRYEAGDRDFWLLGDSGYPLEPWLLTPLPDAEPGTPEFLYTEAHCKTRSVIERCNGVLKNSWGCLSKKRVLYYDPVTAGYITYACCVLHNLRILYKMEHEDYDSDDDEDDVSLNSGDEDNVVEDNEDDGGVNGEEEEDESSDSQMSVSEEESAEEDEEEIHEGEVVDEIVGVLNVLGEARAIQNAVIQLFAQRR